MRLTSSKKWGIKMSEIFLILIIVLFGFIIVAVGIYLAIKKIFGYDKKEPEPYRPQPVEELKNIRIAKENIEKIDKRIADVKSNKSTDANSLLAEFRDTQRRN